MRKRALGVDYGGTSADGVVHAGAGVLPRQLRRRPTVMIDEKLYGRVDARAPRAMLADWRQSLMAVRIYISRDAAAQALGADETAAALQRRRGCRGRQPIKLMRTGSRGMVWLEPLVEVEDAQGERIAYGPVTAEARAGTGAGRPVRGGAARAAARRGRRRCRISRARSA